MSLWTEVKGSWSSVFEVWGSYWKLYGGWRALLVSPYFHVAIFCTAICYRFWSRPEWWDTVISVAPTFLGFTLAGLAIFFSVSDEGFKRIIAYKDSDSPSSPFLDIVVAFVNFVVWQGAAFLMALIAKSLLYLGDRSKILFGASSFSQCAGVGIWLSNICLFITAFARRNVLHFSRC